MLEFCKENKLVVMNTMFQQHPRRLYTWKMPGDRYRNQIDYIIVRNRFKNCFKNVQTYPGADVGSDHSLLMAKIQVQLKIPKRKMMAEQKDLDCLKTEEMKQRYAVEVNNKYEALLMEEDEQIPNSDHKMWDCVRQSIKHATEVVLPKKRKKEHGNKWMTEEILDLMEDRKKAKSEEEYQQRDKEIKAMCKKAKEEWYNSKCEEIEDLERRHDVKRMHEKVKDLTDRKRHIKNTGSGIKAQDGKMLIEKDCINERWVEYISDLYNDINRPERIPIRNMDGPEILIEEVEEAIRKLKNGKAPGYDGIRAEELKALDSKGIKMITTLCNELYKSGEIPKDLKHSQFITIPKKCNATDCADHRTISLMSHVTKILLSIIIKRNTKTIEQEIGDTQSGFRPGMGTREGLFNLRIVLDKYLEVGQDVCICFIDYEKAFHRVYHSDIIDSINKLDIDGRDIRLIQTLYWDQTASVKFDDGQSDIFPIMRGVRQGCVLSPKLFNLYTENIFKDVNELKGVSIGGRNVNNLRYADDTALLAENEEQLQKIVDEVKTRSERMGLKMNIKKTKVMLVHRSKETKVLKINVDGRTIDQVKKFKYLGQQITEDGRCDSEVKARIAIARSSFIKLKDVLTSKKLKLTTRKRLVRCYILSTLLYASETWTLSKETEDKIQAFEMWIYRKMLKVSYTDRVTNEEILKRVNEKKKLLQEIKSRKMQYMGHILRSQCLQKQLLEGKVEGRRKRGRPRNTWWADIRKWTGKGLYELAQTAKDRNRWRTMTSRASMGQGK